MSKVFGKQKQATKKPNRNTFDLSFQNNLTLQFGGLYPVMCKEVIPGDSFKIDTTFGLRFMPLKWPVQTRCRADVHFFYVRNRPLWHDFPDWYGKTKDDLSRPYLSMNDSQVSQMFNTGQIGDYMGIPTTVVGEYANNGVSSNFVGSLFNSTAGLYYMLGNRAVFPDLNTLSSDTPLDLSTAQSVFTKALDPAEPWIMGSIFSVNNNNSLGYRFWHINGAFPPFTANSIRFNLNLTDSAPSNFAIAWFDVHSDGTRNNYDLLAFYPLAKESLHDYYAIIDDSLRLSNPSVKGEVQAFFLAYTNPGSSLNSVFLSATSSYTNTVSWTSDSVSIRDWASSGVNPFTHDGQPILAEPFRAYESIYNAFYRDERNNPYIVDGKIEYNKYIPTDDGGADPNVYPLRYRNWEQDFLTTALPSPQQGLAPLVGISSTGTMTFADIDTSDGDLDSSPIYDVKGKWNDDGTLESVSYGSDIPQSVRRSLVNVVTSGISINDFRNVNAFQRWLETNIRRGYKFRDVISSHYGVEPSYAELDMPEFLGGVSQDVSFQQVNQMVESTDNPLGSYAGQAYAVGSAKHSINRYFDEPGYIIAILSVVPTPNYSQLLPKMFTKFDSLDIFFPEFGHIGLQPIPYSEVAPVQVVNSSDGTKLSDTFGYQRAWYDYLASVDEVHGEFRTTLRDFLINRVYDVKPELSPDFLLIDPSQVNQVFAVEETTDKILGQVYFDIKAQRPIPKYGIPRLE